MVIVHSFLDFIPSLFFGAPEAETVLGVLPGHKMLLKGEGYRALKLTIAGGVGAFLIGLAMLPAYYFLVKYAYAGGHIQIIIPLIILSFSIIFIVIEKHLKKKIWSAVLFLLSGALGLLVLNNLDLVGFSPDLSGGLFPLLTGLFGIPTLFISMFRVNKIAKQKLDDKLEFGGKRNFRSYLKASLSASIVSILPAIGAAQAAVIARGFTKTKDAEGFLTILGGINTVSVMFVLTTFFAAGKARTGAVVALKQLMELNLGNYVVLLAVAFAAVGIGALLTMQFGKLFAKNICKIKYRELSLGIIVFLFILIAIFSGLLGVFVAMVAVGLGVLAPKVGVKRIHLMGVLVLPVAFYYLSSLI